MRSMWRWFRTWLAGGRVIAEFRVAARRAGRTLELPSELSDAQRQALVHFGTVVGFDSREWLAMFEAELRQARTGFRACPRCRICGLYYLPKPAGVRDVGLCKRCSSELEAMEVARG